MLAALPSISGSAPDLRIGRPHLSRHLELCPLTSRVLLSQIQSVGLRGAHLVTPAAAVLICHRRLGGHRRVPCTLSVFMYIFLQLSLSVVVHVLSSSWEKKVVAENMFVTLVHRRFSSHLSVSTSAPRMQRSSVIGF